METGEFIIRENEGKPFAVRVAGSACWFFFEFYENVVWFMELCAEDGNSSTAFKLNELGQYERIAWCEVDKEGSEQ